MSSKPAGKGPAPVPMGVAPAMGGGDGGNAPIPIIKFDDDQDGARHRKLAIRKEMNKGRVPLKSKKARRGVFAFLVSLSFKLGVIYLLLGAFWSCPSSLGRFDYNLHDERARCSALAHTKANLSPVLSPYAHAAQAKIQPYTKPYFDAASPYVRTAYKTALPYYKLANKLSRRYYNRNIEPLRKRAIKRGRFYADPHLKLAQQHYSKHVEPRVIAAQKAAKPYQDIYRRDVAPLLNDAYVQSLAAGAGSYRAYLKHVHPLVLSSARHSRVFYVNHFDPAVRRAYTLYLRPQADKALQKVFDWKAHALGSDAIKEAKQGAKSAKKEAEVAEKEKVAEAKSSAARVIEDPTLLDRIHIAKDKVIGGPLAAADPVASAVSDAEAEVELSSIKQQLEAWEQGLAGLIDQEYELTQVRFDEIHSRFAESLPDKFNVLTEDVEIEVEGVFAQLAKSFEKLSKREEGEEKIEAGKALIHKQHKKLLRSRERAVKTLGALYGELEAEETTTQRASVEEVERYISEAIKAHRTLMKSAKSHQTLEKWSGWDEGILPRSQLFSLEIDAIKTGNKKLARGLVGIAGGKKGDIQRQISTLQGSLEELYDTALADFDSFGAKELSAIGGSGAAASVLGSIVGGAKELSEDAKEVLMGAAGSARDAGSEAASLISSKASEASASGSSLVREGAKSIGISVEPETPGEYVQSVYEAAKTMVTGSSTATPVVESASSIAAAYYAEASAIAREAAQRAGLEFDEETYGEQINSIVKEVFAEATRVGMFASSVASDVAGKIPVDASSISKVASAASAGMTSSVDTVASFASSLSRGAAKAAGVQVEPETPAEYIASIAGLVTDSAGSAVEAASSVMHQATRSLASAAGAEVTPEGVGEYAESLIEVAKTAASDVAEAAQSVYTRRGRVVSSASSLAADVGSSASSLVGGAGSTASSLAADAGSSASSLSRRGRVVLHSSSSGSVASAASEASSYLSSLSSEGSHALHQATRSAGSALGGPLKPTPESPSEYLEAAAELAANGGSSVQSVVGEATASAASAISVASASGESILGQAAKSVEKVVERVREEL